MQSPQSGQTVIFEYRVRGNERHRLNNRGTCEQPIKRVTMMQGKCCQRFNVGFCNLQQMNVVNVQLTRKKISEPGMKREFIERYLQCYFQQADG